MLMFLKRIIDFIMDPVFSSGFVAFFEALGDTGVILLAFFKMLIMWGGGLLLLSPLLFPIVYFAKRFLGEENFQ